MNKKFGGILLVAGTCIGSGMIALPMVLAKLGLIPSLLLMLATWFVMYYTSLINLELNLQANQGLSLAQLGRYFSGKTAEIVGLVSLKLLSYSLLAVFIYGGSSIIKEFLSTQLGKEFSFYQVAYCYTLVAISLLLLPLRIIDYLNRILCLGLLAVIALFLAGLVLSVQWTHLPLFGPSTHDFSTWTAVIPIVFTSFGFQVIFHTLTNYCHKNPKMLKQVFFWGSLIPAAVYLLWTSCILGVVYHKAPEFYSRMIHGHTEVGELIQVLSGMTSWHCLQLFVWGISSLAIITSVLGVGLGLVDSLTNHLEVKVTHPHMRKVYAVLLTLLPAYLAVIYVPNAFITVLGFVGMILAVLAIILPIYLFWKVKSKTLYFEELRTQWLVKCSVIAGLAVIVCEIFNML